MIIYRSMKDNLLGIYDSIEDASKKTGYSVESIKESLDNYKKKIGVGYWVYEKNFQDQRYRNDITREEIKRKQEEMIRQEKIRKEEQNRIENEMIRQYHENIKKEKIRKQEERRQQEIRDAEDNQIKMFMQIQGIQQPVSEITQQRRQEILAAIHDAIKKKQIDQETERRRQKLIEYDKYAEERKQRRREQKNAQKIQQRVPMKNTRETKKTRERRETKERTQKNTAAEERNSYISGLNLDDNTDYNLLNLNPDLNLFPANYFSSSSASASSSAFDDLYPPTPTLAQLGIDPAFNYPDELIGKKVKKVKKVRKVKKSARKASMRKVKKSVRKMKKKMKNSRRKSTKKSIRRMKKK